LTHGNNYYRVRKTIGKTPEGKAIQKDFYGKSKKEAEKKCNEYMERMNNGLPTDYDKITFSELFYQWFYETKTCATKASTKERYEQIYRLKIKNAYFYSMKLIDIRSIDIQTFYNEITKDFGYNATINVHKLINPFFKYCYEESYLVKPITKNIKLPKKEEIEETSYPVLDNEDIKILHNYVTKNNNAFIFLFAALTGLRQGEILALTYRDIDLVTNMIKVNKNVRIVNKELRVERPKSKTSIRTVPLSTLLFPHLEIHIENEKQKHLDFNLPFNENTIVFSSKSCGYREGRNVRRSWYRLQKKLNIGTIDFKGLRHTFCTKLSEEGVPLKTASVIMGHSNINITSKYYTHVNFKEQEKAIQSLNRILE
jgi:integrase